MRFASISKFILSPEAARELGLELIAGIDPKGKSSKWQEEEFHAHYGSSSLVIATQWFDLCCTDNPAAKLSPEEISTKGFKCFVMAHFFLWQNPKNARTFGSRFGVCERLAVHALASANDLQGEIPFGDGWTRLQS